MKKELELILRAILVAILAASLTILAETVPWAFFMDRLS